MTILRLYTPGAIGAIGSQAASAAGGFAALLFLTNMLTKEDFGAYSFAFSVMILLSIVGTLGLDRSLLLKLAGQGDPRGQKRGGRLLLAALGLSALAAGSLVVLVWTGSSPLARAMDSDITEWWLNALALVILPMSALLILRAWFQANHRFAVSAAMPGAADLLRALLIGLAFVLGAGKAGVAGAVVAAFSLPAIALLVAARHSRRGSEHRVDGQDLSRGLVYMFQRVSEAGSSLIDLIIIGLIATETTTAEFAVAVRLASLADTGRLAVAPTFVPRARHNFASGNRDRLLAEFRMARLLALLVASLVGLVMLALGPAILSIFGGFGSAYGPLLVVTAGVLVTAASGPHIGYLTVTGEVHLPAVIRGTALILTAAGLVLVVPATGAFGAAFVILSIHLAVNASLLAALWLRTGFRGFSATVHGLTAISVGALCATALGWVGPWIACMILLAVALGVEETEYGVLRRALARAPKDWG